MKTPNLDRIHGQGARFTDFHVSPSCSPTRAALMSERLAPGVVTLAEALRRAGYAPGLFGKWHLGDEKEYLPRQRGFDEVLMHGSGGVRISKGSGALLVARDVLAHIHEHNAMRVDTGAEEILKDAQILLTPKVSELVFSLDSEIFPCDFDLCCFVAPVE